MKNFFKISTAIFCAAIFFILSLNFASAAEILHKGEGIYKFEEPTGKTPDPIDIYYYRPKNWKNGDKIFVAFHGSERKAKWFINGFKKIAEQKNFLLICPEFSKAKYPYDNSYNYGRVFLNKKITPKNEWTYNVANKIIDDVKIRADAKKSKVIFFGHSAGSQFISRYIFLADKIKADTIIAANAGTYMMPDENIKYPFGLKNSPVTEKNLKRAYKQDVIILLGENDVKYTSKGFPNKPPVDKQGLNRFERGKNFYAQSKKKAEELRTKFNWKFLTVPNVGHNGIRMAKVALKYLD